MGKNFRPDQDKPGQNILYRINLYTKDEFVTPIDSFGEVLSVGDYVSYPLDIPNAWRYFKWVATLPKKVAQVWLDEAGIERPTNKLMYIVEVRKDLCVAVYLHDFKYTLYNLRK